jgi:hypothetical protein
MTPDDRPLHDRPFHEPFGNTLVRNNMIALIVAAIIAVSLPRIFSLPTALLVAYWPTFGGHFIEILYLNYLRPLLPGDRSVRTAARLLAWYIGGAALALGARFTAELLTTCRTPLVPTCVFGGLAFIGIELIAHLALSRSNKANFYDGRG